MRRPAYVVAACLEVSRVLFRCAVVYFDRGVLGGGGAVVVGDRRVVDRRDRNRDRGRAAALGVGDWRRGRGAVVTGLRSEEGRVGKEGGVGEGAVGVEGQAAVGRVAELGGGEGVGLGVGVVGEDAGGRAVEHCDRAALGHGGAVVVGDRRVVHRRDRNRDSGRGAALGVGDWRRARRAVVTGLVGEGVGGGLAAVVAVAEGAVGVEGHAAVGRVAELRRGEGVALGVGVVGEDAGGVAVEGGDRAALGHGGRGGVGVGLVVHRRDRNRGGGRGAALGVRRAVRRAVVAGLVGEGVAGGLAAVVAVAEGAVGVEGHAAVGRVAELGGGEGVALGVRVVGQDAGGGAVEHGDRAALRHGGAVVVGDRRVVDRRARNRDGGRGAALGVRRAVRRAVVAGLVGEGVGGCLAAVVAVAEGAVGVEGHAAVGRVAELGGGEGVGLGVGVVGEDAGGGAVEHGDRAALGHGGAVVVGDRRVVDRRDRNRDGGRGAALGVRRAVRRAVVAGLVGEGVGGCLAAVVAVAEGAVGVEGHASVGRVAELGGGEGVALGVRVVGEDAGGRAVEIGRASCRGRVWVVVVGDRRDVEWGDRNRGGGSGSARGVLSGGSRDAVWPRVWGAVVCSSDLVVAVAEGAVGVEGHASVGRVAELGGGEGVALGVRVVGEDAGGRAVEIGRASCRGRVWVVVVGDRRDVEWGDRNRGGGSGSARGVLSGGSRDAVWPRVWGAVVCSSDLVVAVAEGAVGVEGHASVGRVAELGGGEGVALGVRVVGEDAGGRAVEIGRASCRGRVWVVVVGDRRDVEWGDRNRGGGSGSARGVLSGGSRDAVWPRVWGAVVCSSDLVVAVAEGAVGVEGHASVGRVAELGGGEGVALGVRVVGEDAGGRAVEHCGRGARRHAGAVAVGYRRVVEGRDRNRDGGRAAALGVGHWRRARLAVVAGLVAEVVTRSLHDALPVSEGAVGVEGHAPVGRVAELGGGEGVGLGVRVVGEDAGGRAVEHCDRAALGHGGAVGVGDRRAVDRCGRNRVCRRALALGVCDWCRARAAVLSCLVGEGVGLRLSAALRSSDRAVGVEGHAPVGRVAELGGGEGVGLGVRVVGEDAGGRAVEHCDRAALGHGGAVVVGDRRVVDRRDRNRDRGRGAALGVGDWRRARRAVVTGLVGEGVAGGLAAVVAVAEGAVGVEGHASVHGVAELRRGEGVGLGVRVVGEDAGGRAVEHCDRAALGPGGAVVVGARRVVDGRDGTRHTGRAAAPRLRHSACTRRSGG